MKSIDQDLKNLYDKQKKRTAMEYAQKEELQKAKDKLKGVQEEITALEDSLTLIQKEATEEQKRIVELEDKKKQAEKALNDILAGSQNKALL